MPRLIATYRLRCERAQAGAIAEAIALEQSVEVPMAAVRDPWVRDEVVGRVESVSESGDGAFLARIALADITMGTGTGAGFDAAQTINMLFGNSSLHDNVELLDVELPEGHARHFAGPRFGAPGLRRLLDAPARALTCTAIKPQGLPVDKLAALCEVFVRGGVDIIKDDHGMADQAYAPFARRVAACQRAVERACRETGRRALYAPSMVGAPRALAEQARIVRDEGVGAVLLAPALVGMPAFHELVQEEIRVPVLAHPAYAGAARVAPPLLLGRLFRLLGADAVIYPNYGGRFAYSEALCRDIAGAALSPWQGLAPILPVPAGGMTVERVPEMLRFYGRDVMLLIGGSLLVAGDGSPELAPELLARTRAFTEAAAQDPAAAR